jgi:fumarate hydratase class I
MLGYIDSTGVYLEALAERPGVQLRGQGKTGAGAGSTDTEGKFWRGFTGASLPVIKLNRPINDIRADLSVLKTGDRVLLSGKLLVARDAAHLKWHTLIAEGRGLPSYVFDYPIYYAGPAATPPGKIIGSIGPTTAQRMDPYAEELMSRGASLITIAKGNRSPAFTAACKKYGGFYLGAIGGAAALPAEEKTLSQELVDYPELGMEAVRLREVRNFLVFIGVDDKGNELYKNLS